MEILVIVGLLAFVYALVSAIGYFGFGVAPLQFLKPRVRLVSLFDIYDESRPVFKDKDGNRYCFPYTFPSIGAVKLNDDGTTSPYKEYYYGVMEYKWTETSSSKTYLEI